MASIYEKAPQSVIDQAKALVEKFHFDLKNLSVRIDFIFAHSTVDDDGVPTGPAITHGGYAALGLARILGSKDRVMGRGDCEIVLDGDRWPNLSAEKQDALIDHELNHFSVKFDKNGAPTFDDARRPKLKLRKHDHQFGWFDLIAKRHGADSVEVNQFRELCEDESGQYFLPFLNLENVPTESRQTVTKLLTSAKVSQSAKKFVRSMAKSGGGSIKFGDHEEINIPAAE